MRKKAESGVFVMSEKNRSTVRIGGIEYTFSAEVSEEYIHKVALYVDKKMNVIQKERNNLSTAMIAVLAAVNITNELFKAQEELKQYKDGKKTEKTPVVHDEGQAPMVITGLDR